MHSIVSQTAAFVVPTVARLGLPPSTSGCAFSVLHTQALQYRTAVLLAIPPVAMADFSGAALSFFNNVRVPAALIAGTSFSSLFSLVKLVNSEKPLPPLQSWLLKFYHIISLATLILSLNAVMTATAASTTLLLGDHVGMATSAYEFLNREIRYEFVTTRWSFLMANLFFIAGIATRAVLEFELLNAKRRRHAMVVVLAMTALLTHLLGYVNSTLHCWDSVAGMTWDVIKLIVGKAIHRGSPMEAISVVCLVSAVIVAAPLFKFNTNRKWWWMQAEDDPMRKASEDTTNLVSSSSLLPS
jgi:hypothetical protein